MKMRELSPLMHAHKVKAPTLLCIGSKDQRVPYSQGIEFYHKIRANGCKARYIQTHNYPFIFAVIFKFHVIFLTLECSCTMTTIR